MSPLVLRGTVWQARGRRKACLTLLKDRLCGGELAMVQAPDVEAPIPCLTTNSVSKVTLCLSPPVILQATASASGPLSHSRLPHGALGGSLCSIKLQGIMIIIVSRETVFTEDRGLARG